MESRSRNKRKRTFSNDFDYYNSSYEYFTIQNMNETSRNNFYSSHQSIYSNNFKNTLSNFYFQ